MSPEREELRTDSSSLPPPPVTGDPAVDEVLSRLADVNRRRLEDQLPLYEAVHHTLVDRLADVEG